MLHTSDAGDRNVGYKLILFPGYSHQLFDHSVRFSHVTESAEAFATCYKKAKEAGQAPHERGDLSLKRTQKL